MGTAEKIEALAEALLQTRALEAMLDHAKTCAALGTLDEADGAAVLEESMQDVFSSCRDACSALREEEESDGGEQSELN